MARQISISDEVFEKIKYLKDTLELESYSKVIDYLIKNAEIDLRTIINLEFEEFKGRISRYIEVIEPIELIRVFYLTYIELSGSEAELAVSELRTAILRVIQNQRNKKEKK